LKLVIGRKCFEGKIMSESNGEDTHLSGELIKSIFEQQWLQLRHVESERLWFTNIYAAIMAGVLAFISKGGEETPFEFYMPLLLFLVLLSVIGIVVVIRLGLAFYQHAAYVLVIAEAFGVGKYVESLWRWKVYQKKKRSFRDAIFTVASMFLLFYMVSLGGLLAMVTYVYTNSATSSLLVMMAIIPIFILAIWWQNKKSNEIMKLVKNKFPLASKTNSDK
jgi:hypothetical protein